jgi:hypothetical protein
LNLRPPGPQPEGSGCVERDSACYADRSWSELGPVAPGLDPVRAVRRASSLPMLRLDTSSDATVPSVASRAGAPGEERRHQPRVRRPGESLTEKRQGDRKAGRYPGPKRRSPRALPSTPPAPTPRGLFGKPLLAEPSSSACPLYLHPALAEPQVQDTYSRGFKPEVEWWLSGAAWGRHAETGLHVLRIVVGGVFDRFPGLQMIVGHMGEMLPSMLARIDDSPLLGDRARAAGLRVRSRQRLRHHQRDVHPPSAALHPHGARRRARALLSRPRVQLDGGRRRVSPIPVDQPGRQGAHRPSQRRATASTLRLRGEAMPKACPEPCASPARPGPGESALLNTERRRTSGRPRGGRGNLGSLCAASAAGRATAPACPAPRRTAHPRSARVRCVALVVTRPCCRARQRSRLHLNASSRASSRPVESLHAVRRRDCCQLVLNDNGAPSTASSRTAPARRGDCTRGAARSLPRWQCRGGRLAGPERGWVPLRVEEMVGCRLDVLLQHMSCAATSRITLRVARRLCSMSRSWMCSVLSTDQQR